MNVLTDKKRLKLIHGLSNQTRLSILEALKEEEKNVSDILGIVGGTQSNLSQHLACLKECGIIKSRQDGKYAYYSLSNHELVHLLNVLDKTVLEMHWQDDEQVACVKNVD
ncbi:DNA-binding transcriptional regulator, ArsR family [Pilibacter termitis]|uniref:DNA-binding transcriptional regulator, ArsR family n=1 Tax=Pilibacter termitis TaxID=263852 RepID=A0A1T4L9W0_9ENTE|nr:metalloregulator ArsR/SmtB family transcription factor [Pilibacter termitis]SJZ51358.1 DNA-binding transcriptional regulator, ArsR family [Pilibacter termitis]